MPYVVNSYLLINIVDIILGEDAMQPEHLILETDQAGNLKGVPKLPPNKLVEMYVLFKDKPVKTAEILRKPNPEIAGKIKISGNIFDSLSENKWNLPK